MKLFAINEERPPLYKDKMATAGMDMPGKVWPTKSDFKDDVPKVLDDMKDNVKEINKEPSEETTPPTKPETNKGPG
jgi:hypothetical protein